MADIKILAEEKHQPVEAFDLAGNIVQMGTMTSRIYKGESVQRHMFSTPDGKTYDLSPTKDRFSFINHTEAIRPLLDLGYTIERQHFGRGGLDYWAALAHPSGQSYVDPITWDRQFFEDEDRRDSGQLRESFIVKTSVRPGKGMTYNRGWFRLLCSNGLESEALGLGHYHRNHTNWRAEDLQNTFKVANVDIQQNLMGPYVGSAEGGSRFANYIQNTLLSSQEQQVPLFLERYVSPLRRLPNWYLEQLSAQMQALASGVSGGAVHMLDVLNAVTNPMSLVADDENRAISRMLTRSNAVAGAAVAMVGVMSLS